MSDNLSEASSAEREHARIAAAAAALAVSSAADDHNKPSTPSNSDHFLSAAFHGNGLHQQEHEARVEALQVRNPAPIPTHCYINSNMFTHLCTFHRLSITWPEAWDYLICPTTLVDIPWPVIPGSMVPPILPHILLWPQLQAQSLVGLLLHQAQPTPLMVSRSLIGSCQDIEGLVSL